MRKGDGSKQGSEKGRLIAAFKAATRLVQTAKVNKGKGSTPSTAVTWCVTPCTMHLPCTMNSQTVRLPQKKNSDTHDSHSVEKSKIEPDTDSNPVRAVCPARLVLLPLD